MTAISPPAQGRDHPLWALLVLAVASAVALASARPYAGCWNDGSRLATVEAIVDQHTLVIDDSIFVKVPHQAGPYDPSDPGLSQTGTCDKLFIGGRYYSDKSPVPALLLAAVYQALQWTTGLRAQEAPARFCYWLTVCSSGLAYVVAVWCVFRLGQPLRIPLRGRMALTVSFAMATLALPYVRHVNNHVLLLGAAAAIVLQLTWLARESQNGSIPQRRLLLLGTLTGLGYSIDLGAGPVLFLCVFAVVTWRTRRPRLVLLFLLTAVPWLVLHHAVNFAVGGTIKPANAVAGYFQWPGCPFTEASLTGGWHERSLLRSAWYAVDLLIGKSGFLGHNLPLVLAMVSLAALFRRNPGNRPELLFAVCWSLGTWLAYALTSTNYSGRCCSIRWFVPLIAPGYLVLAQLLRQTPRATRELGLLAAWGGVLGAVMWWGGPWHRVSGSVYWPLAAGAILSWITLRHWPSRRHLSADSSLAPSHPVTSRAA